MSKGTVNAGDLLSQLRGVRSKRVVAPLGVQGAAGLGKTHLLRHLLREVGCRTYTVSANASAATLGQLLPEAGVPDWVSHSLAHLRQGEALGAAATADMLAAQLAVLAPVVLCIEDLHDASAEQLKVWEQLAKIAGHSRGVALIASSRSALPESFEAQTVQPLTFEAVSDLLTEQAGRPLPESAAQWIHERAAGNPLFTIEYFRFLARRGNLWNDGQQWHWRSPAGEPLPDTVEALLARALEVPDVAAATALYAAAALPAEHWNAAAWAALAGLNQAALKKATRHLAERNILEVRRKSGYEFAHPLFREVALREATPNIRQAVALRAVTYFQSQPRVAALFLADAPAAQGQEIYRQAALAAEESGAKHEAAHWWEQLYKLTHEVSAGIRAGELLVSYAPQRTEQLTRSVLQRSDVSQSEQTELTLLRARALNDMIEDDTNHSPEAEALLLALPAQERAKVQGRWLTYLIKVLSNQKHIDRVLELWAQYPAEHDHVNVDTLTLIGDSLCRTGRLDEADALLLGGLGRPDLKPREEADLLLGRAGVCFFRGQADAALEFVNLALGVIERSDIQDKSLMYVHEIALTHRAYLKQDQGQLSAALADMQANLVLLATLGNGRGVASREPYAASILIQLGRYHEAEAMLLRALDVLERHNDRFYLINVLKPELVTLYLETPQLHGAEKAMQHARTALRLAEGASRYVQDQAHLLAAKVEVRIGSTEVALAHLATIDESNAELTPSRLCITGLALERLGRSAEAQTALTGAIAQAQARGHETNALYFGLELARMSGDRDALQTQLAALEQTELVHLRHRASQFLADLAQEGKETQPHSPGAAGILRLDVLGPLRVSVGGEHKPIKGEQRRGLLSVLLQAQLGGQESVDTLQLVEQLYPHLPELEALTRLHQVVYHLRRSLGTGAILTTGTGYALGEAASDARDFLSTGDLSLWRGAAFADQFEVDETLRSTLHHALLSAAEEQLGRDPRAAARAAKLVLDTEPYHRQALALALQALRQAGNRKGALSVYRAAQERFRDVGEALPDDWAEYLSSFPSLT